MGVYIKDMKVPKSCAGCPIGDSLRCSLMPGVPALCKEYALALETNRRHEECPLIPVPPHGRLGDLDALKRELVLDYAYAAADMVDNAPTIIPASEEGE